MICRTREFFGMGIEENMSSSCCAGDKKSSREDRISRYGKIVSGPLILSWIAR